MIKKLIFLLAIVCAPFVAIADDNTYSIDELLERQSDATPCARAVFEQALANNVNMIESPDDASTTEIDTWSHSVFSMPDVLNAVLNCPEVSQLNDDDTIIFETISYRFAPTEQFPEGRLIQINYETQKHVLKQKLLLANKPQLSAGEINPDITADIQAGNVWTNVDPAWYAILIAEHGTLDDFVAPGKTNVLALRYIEDNITTLYPKDHNTWPVKANCTSKTAWAEDSDMINRATATTVGGVPSHAARTDAEKEAAKQAHKNDYYVMGDGDLRFVMWVEIATDVVLTVITWGGYAAVKGILTAARGTRSFLKAEKALKALKTSRDISKWIKTSNRAKDIEHIVKIADKTEDSYNAITKLERTAKQTVKNLTHERDLLKARKASPKEIRQIEQELEIATKHANSVENATKTSKRMHDIENTLKNGKSLSPEKQKQLDTYTRNLERAQQRKQELSNLKPGQKLNRNALEQAERNIKTSQQNINRLRKEQTLSPDEIKDLENELSSLKGNYSTQVNELKTLNASELSKLENATDVQKYKELSQARRDAAHTLYLLRQSKIAFRANRGLLPVRAFKAAKSLRKGLKSAKGLDKAAKVVRANTSGVSAKINDWLFHSTMKNLAAISKVPAQLSTLTFIVKAAGDMYDRTEVSSGDFTNNIDMKPYLLLGADDLEGYEDIINEGMWLFWAGSSTSAADDDAAFLQAMSFAEKFHQDLVEIQDEYDNAACDVDIYVVRPIIRNPGTDSQELYYLFMNDIPWTTHDFNNISPDTVTRTTDENGNDVFTLQTASGAARTQIYNSNSVNNSGATTTNNTAVTNSNTATSQLALNGAQSGIAGNIRYYEPAYDGTKIGGPCTNPSSSANDFTNQILTTGRYAQKSPAFEKAMITKFRTEGECGEHPADRGGYTCYGVSSVFFPQAKRPGFSRADAEDIAWNSFFKKYHLDLLPDAISGDVFMALWGTGSKKYSIGILQKILGLEPTGIVDEETINAAKNYSGNLRTQFLDAREKQFKRGQSEFRTGWLNALDVYRANGCHTIAE